MLQAGEGGPFYTTYRHSQVTGVAGHSKLWATMSDLVHSVPIKKKIVQEIIAYINLSTTGLYFRKKDLF